MLTLCVVVRSPHATFTVIVMKDLGMPHSVIFHTKPYKSLHKVPIFSAPFLVKGLFIESSNSVPVAFENANQSKSLWFPKTFQRLCRFTTVQTDYNGSVHRTTFKTVLRSRLVKRAVIRYFYYWKPPCKIPVTNLPLFPQSRRLPFRAK